MSRSRKPSSARKRAGRGGLLLLVGTICVWLAGVGLVHVITINNIHALGDQQRILEREIVDLKRDISNAQLQITAHTTEEKLKERLIDQRTRLRTIRRDEIWHVSVNPNLAPIAALPISRGTPYQQ